MATDNFCFYLQNRLIQTSQTGGQWYSDTSPFSIPWSNSSLSVPFASYEVKDFYKIGPWAPTQPYFQLLIEKTHC